jgi:hypothetical protein
VLGGTLSFLTAAGMASPAGNYAITPYGQTSGNYAIVFRDGVLTVNAAQTGGPVTTQAGAVQQAIGAQYTGFGIPNLALANIEYLLEESDCQGTVPASGCVKASAAHVIAVRLLNGGIRMPGAN